MWLRLARQQWEQDKSGRMTWEGGYLKWDFRWSLWSSLHASSIMYSVSMADSTVSGRVSPASSLGALNQRTFAAVWLRQRLSPHQHSFVFTLPDGEPASVCRVDQSIITDMLTDSICDSILNVKLLNLFEGWRHLRDIHQLVLVRWLGWL